MRIGIDLGTTNSVVACYRENITPDGQSTGKRFEIIPNGSLQTTPSYITFTPDGDVLFGQLSKKKQFSMTANTIFEVKRMIGHRFSGKEVQENIRRGDNGAPSRWPFKVQSDGTNDDKPVICVLVNGEEKKYSPEKVSAFLLGHLKKTAEAYLHSTVSEVTITVPAYFNDAQRQATLDAGYIAGFERIDLLNEPTAAALAYKQKDSSSIGQRLLVFDFGGGTLDVSIADIRKEDITVVATGGDCYLGGADLDRVLVQYCLEKFCNEKGIDFDDLKGVTSRNMSTLRQEAESAKIDLSTARHAEVIVSSFLFDHDLELTLTRTELESECDFLFQKCIATIDEILDAAGLSEDSIDVVLTVGGSSLIPRIKQLVNDKFPGKVRMTVQPDHAIAYGACVGHLHVLNDVTSHSMGIEVGTIPPYRMDVVIPRFSRVPCQVSKPYVTKDDYQTSVLIRILEGEKPLSDDNHELGRFTLKDLPSLPAGQAAVGVTFAITKNGILTVSALDESNIHNSKAIVVESSKGRLTNEQKRVQKIEVSEVFRSLSERRN
ncbi:hypothetical protein RCL1_005248 [Eukaryota sp. TZLM3-RCL]